MGGADLAVARDTTALNTNPAGIARLRTTALDFYSTVAFPLDVAHADRGIAHELMEIRDPEGRVKTVDGWTGCYTPRELRLLLAAHGLAVERISSVEPGRYGDDEPSTESPEFLIIARV